MSAKRSWKLQEFVAHSDNVTSLAIGPSSGRVMVTGGEDKKVNMWAIGKPNVILSLSGHTTPIECVQFNISEELVCAGSSSGALKIWDLEAAKIIRTLTGHKANAKSLDFHPYGEYIASGSMDTTVRLWDIRRKGCIISYKGHTKTINHLRFSPDGRWVISAGEDGMVKLWDLNAGKLLADFLHDGPVNRVEFHPREFLVATGSSDRTVKFWDLERYELISSTEVEASAVRTVCFHPEGSCLFSGGQDSLRAYHWEPNTCFDAQTLGWGKIVDMVFSSNKMIGASFQNTNVSVWVSSMNNIEAMATKALDDASSYVGKVEVNHSVQKPDQNNRKQSPQRKSFTRPKTQSSKSRKESKQDMENFNKVVEEKLSDPSTNYEQVFQPKSALSRSPGSQRKLQDNDQNNEEAGKEIPTKEDSSLPQNNKFDEPVKLTSVPESMPTSQEPVYHPLANQPPSANQPPATAEPANSIQYPEQKEAEEFPVRYQQPQQPPPQQQKRPSQSQRPSTGAGRQQNKKSSVESKMKGLNFNDFAKVERQSTPNDEESTLGILNKSHSSLCQIMQARLQNLSLVSHLWTEGDIKGAIETASSMSDLSVFVDLLNVLALKPSLWSLDLCGVTLPHIKSLLSSNYESYVETASSTLKLVLKNFSQLIKNTLSTPGNLGVDLVREERYQKCDKCYKSLMDIKDVVGSRTQTSGRVGSICRELSIALRVIE